MMHNTIRRGCSARTCLPTGVMAELSLRNQQPASESDWRSSYALENMYRGGTEATGPHAGTVCRILSGSAHWLLAAWSGQLTGLIAARVCDAV